MRDPIRRKLDEHAARHVPATTDLWPALRRRVTEQPGPGTRRQRWAGLLRAAGGAATVALALAVLVLAGALLGPGGRRGMPGAAPAPAASGAVCPASGAGSTSACRPGDPPTPALAVAAVAAATPTTPTIAVTTSAAVARAATPTGAYGIPTTPDPRYRAPDLPSVTPGAAQGIPWITPSNPRASAGQPAIGEQDVRAVALTAGFWPDQFAPIGPTTIAGIEFLSHAAAAQRLGGHLEATAHDELCLVTLAGGFTRPAPDPGASGPQGQPVRSQHLYLLFDARTGNFLMVGQPSPNLDLGRLRPRSR